MTLRNTRREHLEVTVEAEKDRLALANGRQWLGSTFRFSSSSESYQFVVGVGFLPIVEPGLNDVRSGRRSGKRHF